tara:strand:+ start:16693 stop:16887 length:195 start_codon:yes stop_codon:yes gene_type:complete
MNFIRGIGLPELLIVLFIVLLIFGSTRLPKLANSMGKAIKEFRKGAGEGEELVSKRRSKNSSDK